MLDYIGDVPEDDDEDDIYSDYDRETTAIVYEIKHALEKLSNTNA